MYLERIATHQQMIRSLMLGLNVIDITGDQFRFEPHPLKNDCPVYCDKPNEFFNLFELDLPCEYEVSFSKDVLRKEKEAYDIVCKFL